MCFLTEPDSCYLCFLKLRKIYVVLFLPTMKYAFMDGLLSLFNKWLADTRGSVNLLVLQESSLHCSAGLAVLLLPAALLSFWLSCGHPGFLTR